MSQPDLPSSRLRRRRAFGGLVRGVCYVQLGFLLALALAGGLLALRLAAAPLRFDALSERVAAAIAERMGAGWTVSLGDASVALEGGTLSLRTAGLDIRDPGGALVVRAPHALLGIEPLSLLTGHPQARSIEFRDLQLRALIRPDGSVSFMPEEAGGGEGGTPLPEATDAASAGSADRSALSAALASLFGLLDPGGPAGALDRASVTGARLTLFDARGRESATFNRVDASLATVSGGRRFDLSLQGVDGEWRVGGQVTPEAEEGSARLRGFVEVQAVPVRDLLLFSGQSGLPVTTDLRISGRAEALLAGGRIEALTLSAEAGPGTVFLDDPDMPQVAVEALAAEAAWDEAARRFRLDRASYRAGGTAVALAGTLALPPGEAPWVLDLAGRDAVLDGAAPGDRPVRIDEVSARFAGRPGGVVLEQVSLVGPTLQVRGRGDFGTDPAQGLKLRLESGRIDVRSALRLWPPAVAAKARRFLVPNLRSGSGGAVLDVAMTLEDMRNSVAKRPIPERALRLDFTINEGVITVADGLPPLGPGAVVGALTGTRLDIRASRAGIALADGRELAIPEASFAIPQIGTPLTVAEIAVRAQGGVDALVAFLQAPALREHAAIELEPSEVRGRADLRLQLRLSLDDVPALAELPVSVTGSLGDVALEKPLGRERLEGANLALRYADGTLSLKGEARLGGAPASIDVRQGLGGAGEAVAALTLDEAARARRGLSFGSQLTGPVTVRAVAPLGRPGRPGTRIEIDLTRAAIDQLLPGWTKPAGRPGRATFVLGEGAEARAGAGQPAELTDLVVESGGVLIKGSATLGADGGLERAELGTVRLSPGDDMRARIERAGQQLRVNVRGNNVDARPVLKLITSNQAAGGQAREAREVELTLGANILTGFNGEQVTNASIKALLRQREVRQVQFSGRLGSARLTGQTGRVERAPLLTVETEDAGALLRFLDIYRRMAGGALIFQTTLGDGPQSGSVVTKEFRLRDEPTVGQIIAQKSGGQEVRAARDFDPGDVDVTRLRASFTRHAGRLDVKEAVIWGPLVGFSVKGFIDYTRDRTDIQGTFVPAYGLNNVFSQVPVFGPLLGGGRNEGLFAVNFRVSGPASSPTLTVNPLSAIAPGFLRQLFGAASADDGAFPPPPTPER